MITSERELELLRCIERLTIAARTLRKIAEMHFQYPEGTGKEMELEWYRSQLSAAVGMATFAAKEMEK